MQYSDVKAISTAHFREILSEIASLKPDFLVNNIGCAVEAFEEILEIVHKESLGPENPSCNNSCLAHESFGFQYCEEM